MADATTYMTDVTTYMTDVTTWLGFAGPVRFQHQDESQPVSVFVCTLLQATYTYDCTVNCYSVP